ncbi:UNVERIFIED_CONTAM: hypothetical protein GTU68_011058 [Idotea baltica]|nr:hypothetical protein [Idotea baltica]
MTKSPSANYSDFSSLDIRVGTVLTAEIFAEARRPAYKLTIDFGEMGILKSSAQITDYYQPQDLLGKQIIAVVNFPAKQIATLMSQCLVLGSLDSVGAVTLLQPDRQVKNGDKIA